MKLNEIEEKSLIAWNVVVDALLNQLGHHRDQVLAALSSRDLTLSDIHLGAMCRAAKTLAVFTDPSDD